MSCSDTCISACTRHPVKRTIPRCYVSLPGSWLGAQAQWSRNLEPRLRRAASCTFHHSWFARGAGSPASVACACVVCIESERSRFAQNLNKFGLAIPGSSATCAHFYWSHALAVTFIQGIIKIPKGPEHVGSRRGQQLQISPLLQEVCYRGLTRGGAAWCWPACHLWSHPAGSGLCACPSDWWRVTLRYSTAQASVDSWETNFVEFKTSSSKVVKSKQVFLYRSFFWFNWMAQGLFFRFVFVFNFWMSTISRFWISCGWFDWFCFYYFLEIV